jgi:hypothetical protein
MKLSDIIRYPVSLTLAAFHIATWANILAVLGILGTVASTVSANSSLVNTVFGQQKGAALSLVAIAISHAATSIAAHGDPIGTTTGAGIAIASLAPPVKITNIQNEAGSGSTTSTIPPV